jgi:hypothetical protein
MRNGKTKIQREMDTLKTRKFINSHRNIIYGMMLGDASISCRGGSACFRVQHGVNQKDYLFHKYGLMEEVSYPPKFAEDDRGVDALIKWRYWFFYTMRSTEWLRVWSTFHQNGRVHMHGSRKYIEKVVTPTIMSNLDDHSVALWIMDDGGLSKWPHPSGTRWQQAFRLATCSFTLEENKMILAWFKNRYGLEGGVVGRNTVRQPNGEVREYPTIQFGIADYLKIVERVRSYVPECMSYKFTVDSQRHVQGTPEFAPEDDALRAAGRPAELAEMTSRPDRELLCGSLFD